MVDSAPSSPKRLVPVYFLSRNRSKISAWTRAAQNGLLAHGGEFGAVLDRFDARLQPGLLVRVLDVHELHADRAGIGRLAAGDDLAQRRGLAEAEIVADEDAPVEVARREAVGFVVQLRVVFALFDAERIELRQQMAAHPVAADQDERTDRVPRGFADIVVRRGSRRCAGRPPPPPRRRFRPRRRCRPPGSPGAPSPARTGRPAPPGRCRRDRRKIAPVVGNRARIGEIAFVQVDDEGRVRPGEVGGSLEFPRRLCHGSGLLAVAVAGAQPTPGIAGH